MNSRPAVRDIPERLYSLDIIRGFAALFVVFYHWTHFFNPAGELADVSTEKLPLYSIFHPLYDNGWRSVQLFFCLSGFIFFWLYSDKIRQRKIGLLNFALLRFSRLYPLHLVTLLLVLVGQWIFKENYGFFFAYQFNDGYHFLLQLLFMSHWGLQQGESFNAPVWSVSVEVLLYIAFALICLLGATRWWHLLILVLSSYLLMRTNIYGVEPIAVASVAFFCGGLSFKAFCKINESPHKERLIWPIGLFTLFLWFVMPMVTKHEVILDFHIPYLSRARFVDLPLSLASKVLSFLANHPYETLVFPFTILSLALLESGKANWGRRFSFVGEISYSSYLLHFPLQMLCYGVAKHYRAEEFLFTSPISLLMFFSVLIPLSIFVHRRFELPAQNGLRKVWIKRSV